MFMYVLMYAGTFIFLYVHERILHFPVVPCSLCFDSMHDANGLQVISHTLPILLYNFGAVRACMFVELPIMVIF